MPFTTRKLTLPSDLWTSRRLFRYFSQLFGTFLLRIGTATEGLSAQQAAGAFMNFLNASQNDSMAMAGPPRSYYYTYTYIPASSKGFEFEDLEANPPFANQVLKPDCRGRTCFFPVLAILQGQNFGDLARRGQARVKMNPATLRLVRCYEL